MSNKSTNCYGIDNGVAISVTGFVGFTEDTRNGAEVGKPIFISSWSQYLEYFVAPNSDGYTDFNAQLPVAVHDHFRNGGGSCYVVSIGTQLPETSASTPEVNLSKG